MVYEHIYIKWQGYQRGNHYSRQQCRLVVVRLGGDKVANYERWDSIELYHSMDSRT